MSGGRPLVRVIAQKICGSGRRAVNADIVQSFSSDGCSGNAAQLIVRPSIRGGVPVLSLPMGSPAARSCWRSEEHTSELQSLMRIVDCGLFLKKKTTDNTDRKLLVKFFN